MSDTNSAALPAAIGRFQIVRRLGAGGMGAVYEGFDAAVSRYAAVKILHRAMLEHPEVSEHFVLEAQRIAKLESHPNIPTVYEVGVHEGLPFLAMQKIDGDSLGALLQKRGVASLSLLRSVASGIGSALAFAHERGIVHCDVKPQNVLIDRAGKPYLTDFGISRARPDPLGSNETPLHGLTPYYSSPEQSRGAEADARSDVYSFGILLYEMCTGFNPWMHLASADLPDAMANQKPARADRRNRHVPAGLADALEMALDADPSRRPTALELARLVLRSTDEAARWTVLRQAELGIEGGGGDAIAGLDPALAPRKRSRKTAIAIATVSVASIAATIWLWRASLPVLPQGNGRMSATAAGAMANAQAAPKVIAQTPAMAETPGPQADAAPRAASVAPSSTLSDDGAKEAAPTQDNGPMAIDTPAATTATPEPDANDEQEADALQDIAAAAPPPAISDATSTHDVPPPEPNAAPEVASAPEAQTPASSAQEPSLTSTSLQRAREAAESARNAASRMGKRQRSGRQTQPGSASERLEWMLQTMPRAAPGRSAPAPGAGEPPSSGSQDRR